MKRKIYEKRDTGKIYIRNNNRQQQATSSPRGDLSLFFFCLGKTKTQSIFMVMNFESMINNGTFSTWPYIFMAMTKQPTLSRSRSLFSLIFAPSLEIFASHTIKIEIKFAQ